MNGIHKHKTKVEHSYDTIKGIQLAYTEMPMTLLTSLFYCLCEHH